MENQSAGGALMSEKDARIVWLKDFRVRIDALIEEMRIAKGSAEETLSFRALQQAKHWLGEALREVGAQTPYPNSMDPSNTKVDPTADTSAPVS